MVHPVQQRVAVIGRLARRLRITRSVGLGVGAFLAAALLMGVGDYLFRFQDPGLRYLCSAALGIVLAWGVLRLVYPAWRYRPNDRQVAQRIEGRFPQLQDRLSSSIEFLAQADNDPLAGSSDLRRAVIAGTTAEIERLDFGVCLDSRRSRRAALLAALACLFVVAVCAWDGQATWLAVRRLARPWSHESWPRRYTLEFVKQPTRIAFGSDFEVELVARNGRVPDGVRIFYWFDGDEERTAQAGTMKFLGDKLVHRLDNVRRSFQYRVVAGDEDVSPWTPVEVVEPPHVESLSVRLHPPAYTGWPVANSGENIVALEGTRVEVVGRLTKSAAAVELRTDQQGAAPRPTVSLGDGGREFRIAADAKTGWVLQDSCAYWFLMTDAEGLQGGGERRWSTRVVRDSPPTVALERPAANTFVTPTAVVSLAAIVKDDLAIQSVALTYRRAEGGDAKPDTVDLFRGPREVPRAASSGLNSQRESGENKEVRHDWDLAKQPDLAPGVAIEFWVTAGDYRPQSGQSTVRRLTVISAQELEDRVAARQAYILGQLAEVLRVQREAREQTKLLEIQLDTAGQLHPSDVNQLQAVELNQRQIGKLLSDPHDGVQPLITGLLDELASNRIDSPEVVRRLQQLRSVVELINRDYLPDVQRHLISALRSAREANSRPDTPLRKPERTAEEGTRGPLQAAGAKQDEVIVLLEQLLGTMTQWDSYRRFAREFSRLRQQQQQILQDTERLRLDTLGKEWNALTVQAKANLKRLGERQLELARQLDQTQSRMDDMQAKLRDSDPLAAETLSDALEIVRRTPISGQMRESGRDLENNRVSQAVDTQQEILEHLQEVLDTLSNRREHELDRRLRKLDEAGEELRQLLQQHQKSRQQLEAASKLENREQRQRELQRLARQQQQLAEAAERLARCLQRLQSRKAADLVQQAAAQQRESGQACGQGKAAEALERAQEAERLLDEAERQLQGERQQARQDLFQEQMARLEQEARGIVDRQATILAATAELEDLRPQQQGQLRREQLASVVDLAAQERSLAEATTALAEKVRAAAAFVLAFRGATQDMERAARQLELADTGEAAQRPQQNALARLRQVLAALQRDPAAGQPPQDKQSPAQPPGNQPPSDAVQRLAELKLLKSMQEEIHRRTVALESLRVRKGSLTPEHVRELGELARQQGQLADLLANMSPPREDKPSDAPDESPQKTDEL
jgi:hypothetical protein